jgi:hypothetical protein
MARTTIADVKYILDDTDLTDATITSFINGANVFVTATLTGKSLTDELLAEIERWVTAHMIASTVERMALKEGAGGAEITYTGKWGEGLASTPYGQMAINLDTSNTLMSIKEGKRTATSRAITSFE